MSKPRAFIDVKLHIPADKVDERVVAKHYQKRLYKEDQCRKCPELPYRHGVACQECPAYLAHIKMWDKETIKGHEYISIPAGNLDLVESKLGIKKHKIRDKREIHAVKCDLKFTGKLYRGEVVDGETKEDQLALINKWKKFKTGLIKGRPRTGKSVIGTYAACDLEVNTIITAAQNEFLDRFEDELRDHTNCFKLLKQGQRTYLRVHTLKDLKKAHKYRIVAVNYQKFIRNEKSRKRIQKYLWNRTLVVVDEVHMGNAASFARFLNALPCKYNLGLTATDKRVDRLHVVINRILGPVRAKGVATATLPTIELWETGFGGNKKYKAPWMVDRFLFDPENSRNRQIIKQVFKDLRSNKRHSILIPCSQRKHVDWLVNAINDQARLNNKKKGEKWHPNIAVPYYAQTGKANQAKNKELLKTINNLEHRVVVAIGQMVKFGLNVKAWTHVYVGVKPTSNGPNFYQLANRVCTVYQGKPSPVVRLMVDYVPMSYFCARKLFWTEILPGTKDRPTEPVKYKMTGADFKRLMEIAKYPKIYHPKDKDEIKKEQKSTRFF